MQSRVYAFSSIQLQHFNVDSEFIARIRFIQLIRAQLLQHCGCVWREFDLEYWKMGIGNKINYLREKSPPSSSFWLVLVDAKLRQWLVYAKEERVMDICFIYLIPIPQQ